MHKKYVWPELSGRATPRRRPLFEVPSAATFLRLLAGLLLLISGSAGIENQDDPKELLLSARRDVLDSLQRLPRYVCTQTVDRTRYEPGNPDYGTDSKRRLRSCDDTIAATRRDAGRRRLSSSDRLRLDVAVSHDVPGLESEMYSWAGEERFGERDLFEFVQDGAVSTGSFSSMLASIFGGDAARLSYGGDTTVGGRLLSQFGFSVQQEKSKYLYVFGTAPSRQSPVAYDGTIFIDPKTSELSRLLVRTSQLPPETGACQVSQALDYARVRINGADFLLPTEARVSVIRRDGTEAENRIQYSACHEFRGESTVRFDQSAEEGKAAALERQPPDRSFALKPGLSFKVTFTQPIDPAIAAAGDLINGELRTAIRDHSRIFVPQGARITGRILRVRRFYPAAVSNPIQNRRAGTLEVSLVVAIRLETIEIQGRPYPLKASFDAGARRSVGAAGPLSHRVDLGSFDTLDAGVFEFLDPNHIISGLESSWLTIESK